ncbi:MAG: hypothetical protein ABIQ16_10090, partial [Polyangiaceae bacterium]
MEDALTVLSCLALDLARKTSHRPRDDHAVIKLRELGFAHSDSGTCSRIAWCAHNRLYAADDERRHFEYHREQQLLLAMAL